MEPFLKIGVTFAVLNLSGRKKIPEEKERLKMLDRWLEIGCSANFKIFKGILLIPVALLLLNPYIILEISSSVQGFIINESLHGFDK